MIRSRLTLFTTHLDAWGVTFAIASTVIILHNAVTLQTLLLILAVTVGYWLGFAANDYFDAPYDAQEPSKARRNFFVMHPVSKRVAYSVGGGVLVFAALVFGSFGWRGLMLLIPACFIMWAYSAPPLRLKSRPGFDVLTHAFFVETFPYFSCLFLIGAPWTPIDRILLLALFAASFSAQLEQQSRDFEVDARTDPNFTTLVGLGVNNVLVKAMTVLVIVLSLLALLSGAAPLFLMPFFLLLAPFLIHRLFRSRHGTRSERFVFMGVSVMLVYLALIWVSVLLY